MGPLKGGQFYAIILLTISSIEDALKSYISFELLNRQPADESTENFTKYCINRIEMAYVVIFATTLFVGVASAFYIAQFKFELKAILIEKPNFKTDYLSFMNNDGLLSQAWFQNDVRYRPYHMGH